LSAIATNQVQTLSSSLKSFYTMCKPRVTMLIVFTAMIGMFLATPGAVPWNIFIAATIGIGMASGAAAAFNCLVEQAIDAKMARTRARPLPTGQVTSSQTFIFASVLASLGLGILFVFVNPLTMWLTLATFVGYAIIYTVYLKPATPAPCRQRLVGLR
jgi:heme o synthase